MSGQISAKRERALVTTDTMAPGLRECVHEFGYPIVVACISAGVRDPRRIRELVKEIWDGARQTTQGTSAYGTLDWLLIQAGANISAKTLYRVLADHSLVLTGAQPTRAMLNASMAEVSNFDLRCTKQEKHHRRLSAALNVARHSMIERGINAVPAEKT